MEGDLASQIFDIMMSEYTLKSVVRLIYHVLDFKKSCVSMLRERLIHSLYYPEFVELKTSFIKTNIAAR